MPLAVTPESGVRAARRRVAIAVAVLLAWYVTMALTASREKGLSFDEGEQIAIGYGIWQQSDFRMEPANGDFVKRWATLPLLVSRPNALSENNPWWRSSRAYEAAYTFFYLSGNDPASLRFQCRAMMTLLAAATGLLIFFCARELAGNVGGLVALGLFVFSPSMLAFGAIVSTEMSVCFALLGSTWCIWRLLHRVTWAWLLGSLGFVALLALSKLTAVLLFPITAMLIVVKLHGGRPLEWSLGLRRTIRSRRAQCGIFGGLFLLHAVATWSAVWAHYDFRYVPSASPDYRPAVLAAAHDPIDPTVAKFLAWSYRTHFLPESYLRGTELLLGQNDSRVAFMDGQWKFGGWRTFFPYAMWAKTPPAVVLLAALAAIAWWGALRSRRAARPDEGDGNAATLGGAIPFAVLIAVYLTAAIGQNLNIGFRHVLPVYPALYVLTGAGIGLLWSLARRWSRVAVIGLFAWLGFESAKIFPHYLAYFSPVVGGPAQGYRHLVDSSLDWGMDLPGLERWLAVNNPADREPVFFAYFGTGCPDRYQIKCNRLPGCPEWRNAQAFPLTPGIYAISATLLQSLGEWTVGPWNKVYERAYQEALANMQRFEATPINSRARRALVAHSPPGFWEQEYGLFEKLRFGRLCAWLRHQRPPDDQVGYSILIWRLNRDEVNAAGLGPPAELADAPLPSGG